MKRFRMAVLAALAVLIVAAGSALALGQPRHETAPVLADASQEPVEAENEAPPTEADLAHALDRLEASGYTIDADALAGLADTYGTGGAVRLVAWADASGRSIEEIAAMRNDGQGWGQDRQGARRPPGHRLDHGQWRRPRPRDRPGPGEEERRRQLSLVSPGLVVGMG